jgi:acyl-homoserine lactone acylase PvdQ
MRYTALILLALSGLFLTTYCRKVEPSDEATFATNPKYKDDLALLFLATHIMDCVTLRDEFISRAGVKDSPDMIQESSLDRILQLAVVRADYAMKNATMQRETQESLTTAIKYAKASFVRKPTKLAWNPAATITLSSEELILPRRFDVGKKFMEIVGSGAVAE